MCMHKGRVVCSGKNTLLLKWITAQAFRGIINSGSGILPVNFHSEYDYWTVYYTRVAKVEVIKSKLTLLVLEYKQIIIIIPQKTGMLNDVMF